MALNNLGHSRRFASRAVSDGAAGRRFKHFAGRRNKHRQQSSPRLRGREQEPLMITESTTSRGLGISVLDLEGHALVSLRGRVSIDSSPDLRDRLLAILDRWSPPTLTIDLAEVAYIDCAGIAMLMESLKIAHGRKTTLVFRGLQDRPRYFLQATGLLYRFGTSGRAE